VASQEAFIAGVLPDPSVASDKPARGWIWRDQILATQNGTNTEISKRITADIRGARKLENGELFLIADNNNHTGTVFSVNVTGLVRCLFKLP